MIPYSRQHVSEKDIEAVVEVLRSDFLTQGPVVPKFEQALCAYTGAKHAVCVNSATSALHIACLALGLGPGDWLWTSPITFVASANCALFCGASVDFVDIDPRTGNMSVDCLRAKLETAELNGTLPKIVEPVHLAGASCDMREIQALSKKYGFKVLEDASHALGGRYNGRPVGCCAFSDITVFSFHPVKPITTGEGGAALTNDPELSRRMRLYASHGIERDPARFEYEADGPWYTEAQTLGYNYRMSDLEAALGCSQLTSLDEFVLRRQVIAKRYKAEVKRLDVEHLSVPETSCVHLFVALVPEKKQRYLFDHMRRNGFGVNVHYKPLYRNPTFALMALDKLNCPNSETYYKSALSLPVFSEMTVSDQELAIRNLAKALSP